MLPTKPIFKRPAQVSNRTAPTTVGLPGYTPTSNQPTVDLFKDAGGYAGLFGLSGIPKPGTYNLNELMGIPKATQAPVVPQYSEEQATQSLSNQLVGIANNRSGLIFPESRRTSSGVTVPKLSPPNTSNNTKGLKTA